MRYINPVVVKPVKHAMLVALRHAARDTAQQSYCAVRHMNILHVCR